MRASIKVRRGGLSLVEVMLGIAILGIVITMLVAGVAQYRGIKARLESAQWREARRAGTAIPRQLSPIRVLFVGNSMTYFHRMPDMTRALAAHAGDNGGLIVEQQVVGGATLEQHWREGVALEKIQQGNWDFVVLQEQGLREVLIESEGLIKYVKLFGDAAHGVDAFPIQFLPWTRPGDNALLEKVIALHLRVAKRSRAEIAPVGLAWQKAYAKKPALPLVENDGHPTAMGSYAIACVFYAAFFDKSPVGLPARLVLDGETLIDLDESDAQLLQESAWDALIEIRRQAPVGGGPFR